MFEDSSSWHRPAAHPQKLTMLLAEFKFLHMQESIQKIIITTRSTGVYMFVTRGVRIRSYTLYKHIVYIHIYNDHITISLREFVLTHVILTTGACGREALSST